MQNNQYRFKDDTEEVFELQYDEFNRPFYLRAGSYLGFNIEPEMTEEEKNTQMSIFH